MNKTYIQCGINNENTEKKNKFWPVLQAIPLPFSWPYPENGKHSLVFTSKIAVKLFSQWEQLNNLEHICAVGKSTAELIEKRIGPVLYPRNEGLFNLLTQTNFTPNSIVYIFTAENGKTADTLKLLYEKKVNFICKIFPVYRLESFKIHFLEKLFPDTKTLQNSQFIFCCRSGMVLRTAVEQLKTFFSCSDVRSLPPHIYFSVESGKQSIKNEIQALDLIDRISS